MQFPLKNVSKTCQANRSCSSLRTRVDVRMRGKSSIQQELTQCPGTSGRHSEKSSIIENLRWTFFALYRSDCPELAAGRPESSTLPPNFPSETKHTYNLPPSFLTDLYMLTATCLVSVCVHCRTALYKSYLLLLFIITQEYVCYRQEMTYTHFSSGFMFVFIKTTTHLGK